MAISIIIQYPSYSNTKHLPSPQPFFLPSDVRNPAHIFQVRKYGNAYKYWNIPSLVPVGLNGSWCVFHLHVLMTHEGPGPQTAWIQLQSTLKIQGGFLMLRPQTVIVTCERTTKQTVFSSDFMADVQFEGYNIIDTFFLRLFCLVFLTSSLNKSKTC